jgi:hypothetical protein
MCRAAHRNVRVFRVAGSAPAATSTILSTAPISESQPARVWLDRLAIGTGGYAFVGPCLAARRLELPPVIHEANAHPVARNLGDRKSGSVSVANRPSNVRRSAF